VGPLSGWARHIQPSRSEEKRAARRPFSITSRFSDDSASLHAIDGAPPSKLCFSQPPVYTSVQEEIAICASAVGVSERLATLHAGTGHNRAGDACVMNRGSDDEPLPVLCDVLR